MIEIDRMALLVTAKTAFAEWVGSVAEDKTISLADLQMDATVLLVPVLEDEWELNQYIEGCYKSIFEQELEAWCIDSALWPASRSFDDFLNFFEVKVHTLVFDAVSSEYDEFETVTLQ